MMITDLLLHNLYIIVKSENFGGFQLVLIVFKVAVDSRYRAVTFVKQA